jgi:hypothetical protein
MKAGFQTTGISYWVHGELVAARFRDLMNPNPNMAWRLPTWFEQHADWIREQLKPSFELISTYQLWHDCGKPYCRIVDEAGKSHYPDHASVSAKIWRQLGGDPTIGDLIEQDMLCHQLRPAEAEAFASNPHALTLLITALCELHANATMFGGMQSDSFKIKYKRLDKCGNIILNYLKEQS